MTNLTKKSEFYDIRRIISYELCVISCLNNLLEGAQ